MSVLDSSIANIALPTLAREFHASPAASIWVVNAYQIAVLAMLLPLAALGERVGFRRISQWGLVVFTLASLACALAPSLLALTLARTVQGLGAAGIMSVNAALVRSTYPQRLLGRAIGINAFAVATSAAIGPTVASAVLAVATWRWLFAINGPIGAVTVIIAMRALPESERFARPLDLAGILLHVASFAVLASGLQAFANDAAAPLALAQLAGGGLLAVALARRELHRAAPLVPFELLRIPLFALSIATSVCSFAAQSSALVALPFEIQRLGHSAVATGLLLTPWPLAVAATAPVAGRLADRYPAGALGALGLTLLGIGLILIVLFPQNATAAGFIWRVALCGVGFGLFQSPNNRAMLLAAPRARAGAAGGMLGTARLLGQTLGAAAVAVLFRAFPSEGSRLALSLAAAFALSAALVSVSRLSVPPASPQTG
jgi:DHA2 family multidrug resistance protein-like MFS transporter